MVSTIELKSTEFTEVIELERTVTPDEEKRVDHIFIRRKKICKRHPEGFGTEEYARFDIAWPEEVKEEIKEYIMDQAKDLIQDQIGGFMPDVPGVTGDVVPTAPMPSLPKF